MFNALLILHDITLLIARAVLSLVFITHGVTKVRAMRAQRKMTTARALMATAEIIGGILLVLGLFTQVTAIALAILVIMSATYKMKKKTGLIGGYEFELVVLVTLLLITSSGAGWYSLEKYGIHYLRMLF